MIISIKNMSLIRNNEHILKNISVNFPSHKINIILGKSGSGKSCLIKACAKLMAINSGTITIDKQNIDNIDITTNIGFVFQSNALFDSLTIKENLTFGMQKEINDNAIKNILHDLKLNENILTKYPNEISGGMQKRIAIARSIIQEKKILFLDEPTTGLDPVTSYTIGQTIQNIFNSFKQLTIICITHDIQLAKQIGHHFILLQNKNIAWEGKSLNNNNSDDIINKFINGKD
ncbi:MAG: ATP-binding cassette domain-containing protein [Pseudomonadota bacterium]